jgi:DNA-binding transcriptional LysR family regulator
MAHLPNSWTFAPQAGSSAARTVQFTPRLIVNSTYAAVASTVAGRGVARMYSYQVAAEVARGELEIVLADDEDPKMPAHLISPQGRLSVPKVRAFTDFAVPRLKKQFVLLKKSINAR